MTKSLFSVFALAGALLLSATAAADTFFTETFDSNPTLSPTAAPGVWYTDRYNPRFFDSQFFDGDNRLRLGISFLDDLAYRLPGYQTTFYNTHGRAYDIGNGVNTLVKAKLHVGADWGGTSRRRSDIWGVMADNSNAVTSYPIIGFANVTNAGGLVCRVWDDDFGWIDVSANVPGGVVAGKWYELEMRLRPGRIEFLVDGALVYTDFAIGSSVKFKSAIIQGYNFGDGTLGASTSYNNTYDVYWDDFTAAPLAAEAAPVDLNGSYHSPSSSALTPGTGSASGIAVAATIPIGFGQVYERSGVYALPENVVNGTFTPFNDGSKKPNLLGAATANGLSMEADVSLAGTWKPFQWGNGVNPEFATGDTFAVGWINAANSFGVQFVKNLSGQYVARLSSTLVGAGSLAVGTSPATFPAGTTKVRVNASVSGGFLTATATPLDGPDAGVIYLLGTSNGTDMDTNSPWLLDVSNVGFIAGFETHEHVASAAHATVSNFTSNVDKNALFSFADDPYVRSTDASIAYRVGQANLLQPVNGFQAFMNALGGQTFGAGAYTGLYNTFIPPTITALLEAAGSSDVVNQSNASVLDLLFAPGGAETATGTGFNANAGTKVNLFSDTDFNEIIAKTVNSNVVLIDNTKPSLAVPALSGSAVSGPSIVAGDLVVTTTSSDPGVYASGLDYRPTGTITWSDSSVTPVTTYSTTANTFVATVPITGAMPNGLATLSLTVCDRAGNCETVVKTFVVSSVVATLNINELGVVGAVNRRIDMTFGGSLGGSPLGTVSHLVAFDIAGQGSTTVTYAELDVLDNALVDGSLSPSAALTNVFVKDPFFSLGKNVALAGPPSALTGTANLTMGDLTNNNVVNVADLAVWAANNGSAQDPNTTLAQAPTPRQANISKAQATVGLDDRNFITAAWLGAGDAMVGGFSPGGRAGRDGSLTVNEIVRETRLAATVVESMDYNKDGRVTREEILLWSRGGAKK